MRVVIAPLHGPDATLSEAHRALNLGACSVGYSEAYHLIPYLRRRPWWRIAVGELGAHPRGAGDVPVLVRRDHAVIERWAIQACDAAQPLELAPARWITGFAYEHPLGVVEHINPHPNPYFAPRATLSLRKAYVENMDALEVRIRRSLNLGRLPVVGGDLNMSRVHGMPYAPRELFDRLGLRTWSQGVVWIAYPRSLVLTGMRVLEDNGQDHPWLVADFEGFR